MNIDSKSYNKTHYVCIIKKFVTVLIFKLIMNLNFYFQLIDLLNIFAELIKSPKIQHRSMSSSLKSGSGNEAASASTSSTSSSMSLKPEMASEATSGTSPVSGSKSANNSSPSKGPDWRHILARWKDMGEMATRLLTLCNSFVPPELRDVCLMCVKEMLMLWPNEMLTILVSN